MSYSAPMPAGFAVRHSIDMMDTWLSTFASSSTWPSANLAIYAPICVPLPVVVYRLWFASGSTGTGNVDMALFTSSGSLVVAASNAAKLADITEQTFDVTDTPILPDIYYVGLSCSNNTDTFRRIAPAAPIPAAMGVHTEASAYPLPSTATFALSQTLAFVPLMGILVQATVT